MKTEQTEVKYVNGYSYIPQENMPGSEKEIVTQILDSVVEDFSGLEELIKNIRSEFGLFLNLCEQGKSNRHKALQSRKVSTNISKLLKDYRKMSVNNSKQISNVMKLVKEQITKLHKPS